MLRNILLLFFILSPATLAINITTEFEEYSLGETVFGNIDLTNAYNTNIDFSNIELKNSSGDKLNIALSLIRIDNNQYKYYFDFSKDYKEGNYSIILKNIEYLQDNTFLTRINIFNNITIIKNNYSLSIDPKMIYTNNLNNNFYKINIKSIYANQEITIFKPSFVKINSNEIKLINNSVYILQVLLDKYYNYNYGYNGYLEILANGRNYMIPIYVYSNPENILTNNTKILVSINEKDSIIRNLSTNESVSGYLRFKNIGYNTIERVYVTIPSSLSDIVFIEPKEIYNVIPNQEIEFNTSLNLGLLNKSGYYNGNLTINYDEHSIGFLVEINLFKNLENVIMNNDYQNNTNYTQNLTTTPAEPQKNNISFYLWILLFIVVIFASYFIIKNRKKPATGKNFDSIVSKYMKK